MNLNEFDEFRLTDTTRFHDTLNPALFSGEKMNDKVRDRLLVIAEDFMDHLGISDFDLVDITLSGSNAAYSYTSQSDIDLHLIVNLEKIKNDEIYREIFTSKKIVFNDSHDIKIKGYDVELYVQESSNPVKSLGEYSLLKNKWIKFPSKRIPDINEKSTKEKFTKLVQLSELALRSNDLTLVQNLLATIRKYRQIGLDLYGEFGPENLAYKVLRRYGIVDRLYQHEKKLHSDELSLDENELYRRGTISDANRLRAKIVGKEKFKWLRSGSIPGSHTASELKAAGLKYSEKTDSWGGTSIQWSRIGVNLRESEVLDKPTLSVGELSKLHNVTEDDIREQLLMGIKIELEHTSDIKLAREIALDHLKENPRYYDELKSLNLEESASGYIPSEKEKNDPRFKTALTVDIKPDSIKKNAKKLGLGNIHRSGVPPLANSNGKF